MSDGPNPLAAGWSVVRSLAGVRRPRPTGTGAIDHTDLADVLGRLASHRAEAHDVAAGLTSYVERIGMVDPDTLGVSEALAFWINLYNAGALLVAGEAQRRGEGSVLRLPGGFSRPFVTVAGESLSLDGIEHGKIRRFGDPRIHAALVCGSVSCPTLRPSPYGGDVDGQLDDQMAVFLDRGGLVIDRAAGRIVLSRVFLWYGSDLVRPHRMPAFRPVTKRAVSLSLAPWMKPADARWLILHRPAIDFQPYDWGLRCTVG